MQKKHSFAFENNRCDRNTERENENVVCLFTYPNVRVGGIPVVVVTSVGVMGRGGGCVLGEAS